MDHSSLAGAEVVDATGRVLATTAAEVAASPDGALRWPLPDGAILVAHPAATGEAWARLARAFIHEARSPLNALAIYLELLAARVPEAPPDNPEASAERLLARAHEQVRRVDDLLMMFGTLWAPAAQGPTDLAGLARAASRFAAHEALRRGLQFESRLCPAAAVQAGGNLVSEALVALFGAALAAGEGTRVEVGLELAGDDAVLTVSLAAGTMQTAAAVRALEAAGARVEAGRQGARAAFRRA